MTRLVRPFVLAVLVLLTTLTLRSAVAQELRVFTVVYDVAAKADGDDRAPVVARAVTLFHAGRVYDYVDAADEVTIFEPTQRQFRVFSPSRGIVATVAFDEINQLVKIAREETAKQAESVSPSAPDAAEAIALLRFQLDPRFNETFDDATGRLTLDGGALAYDVRTAEPGRLGVVEAYLDYADWACRLNYLLHPGPVLPEPRLGLNAALRSRKRIPTVVALRTHAAAGLNLRAEHSTSLELNARDRGLIHQWESQLKSESIREVTLRDYQRAVLTAQSR